jgi:RHS repeat-associated protein
MATSKRRRYYPAVILLSSTSALYPPYAMGQSLNWYDCVSGDARTGCSGTSGPNPAISPDIVCQSQSKYVNPCATPNAVLSIDYAYAEEEEGYGWGYVCTYTAGNLCNRQNVYNIDGLCDELGSVDDIFSANACGVDQYPANQGRPQPPAETGQPLSPINTPPTQDSLGTCGGKGGGDTGTIFNSDPTNPVVGVPITVCSGNKFEQTVDYRSTGRNVLSFVRSYNSQARSNSMLGANWQSNWDRSLLLSSGTPATSITAARGDGQLFSFDYAGSGSYTSDSDVSLVLAWLSGSSTYTLTDISGTVETYNSTGVLQSVAYADGYTQTLNYTTGQLTSVTDNQSRALTFTYANGVLATMKDPDSNTFTYDYTPAFPSYTTSATQLLVSVTDPLSHTVTYTYGSGNFPTYLTNITDELGNGFASFTYDTLGEATSSMLADNAISTVVTYNSGGTKTVSFPLGEEITYTFSMPESRQVVTTEQRLSSGSIPAATQTFTYDTNGFLASQTDWSGNKTAYTNNSDGLPTKIVEASGSGVARTTTITWGTTTVTFDKPTEIQTARNTTTFTYDASGNLTGKTITDEAPQSVPYSTSGDTRVMTYTYDSLGHVLTATGPRTDVTQITTYTYDSNGNLSTVKDALSHVTTFTNYNGHGQAQSETDANGTITTFSYDARGRLTGKTISPSGGDAVTTYTYNAAGLMTYIQYPDLTALTPGYDQAHRLNSLFNNNGENIKWYFDYAGQVVAEAISNYVGTQVWSVYSEYDPLGRKTEDIDSFSNTTTYAYDANNNRTGVTDPLGHASTVVYDALNRLSAMTDPLSHTVTTAYDSQDNKTAITDPRSLITSYVYDGFGQVIQEVSPDRGTIVYHRDFAGNVTSKTDAKSIVTSYSYDALNRVITQTYPSDSSENITYTYDAGSKGIGHLTSYSDESGRTTLTYDERGNVLVKARTIGSETYTTTYTYSLTDKVTKIVYPSGRAVTYTYDGVGQISAVGTSLSGTETNLATTITYYPFGPTAAAHYGNGLVGTFTYDTNYRLIETQTSESGVLDVELLSFDYDAGSNITEIYDSLATGRTQTFTYDKDHRVLTAYGSYGTLTYTYDANGNRQTQVVSGTTTNYTYPGTSNRLSSIGTRTFTYDANGNETRDTSGSGNTFTYEARNRYKTLTVGSTLTATYAYDAMGERVSKITGGATTQYGYDESGHLIGEYNGSTGANIREYVWLGDIPLAQIESGGTIEYIATDQVNAPQRMTNATPTIVWDRVQQPFGVQYSLSGTATGNLRFPGQYYDSESGLNQNFFRDYDSTRPGYIQPDPIGISGTTSASMGLYGYASQNPLSFVDPTGRFGETVQCLINTFKDKYINQSPRPDPGNCTEDQRNRYQENVENKCGAAKRCTGTDSVEVLNKKIGLQSACINARKLINEVCYGGGNPTHSEDSIDQRKNAIDNCKSLLSQPWLRD